MTFLTTGRDADPTWVDLALTACVTLALLGAGLCLDQWARGDRTRRRRVALTLGLAAAWAAAWAFIPGLALGPEHVTLLQEGTTLQTLNLVHGRNFHSGPTPRWVTEALSAAADPAVVELIQGQLLLTGLWLIGLFGVSWHVLGRWWLAALFTLGLGLNDATLFGALSTAPSPLVALLALLALPAVALFEHPSDHRARPLATATLLLLTTLLATTRLELAAFGLGLTLTQLACLRWGDARVQAAADALWMRLKALALGPAPRLVAVGLALAAVSLLLHLDAFGYGGAALSPLNPSFLRLPSDLATFLPLPGVALVLLGLAHALRKLLPFGLAPFALVVVYRAYHDGAHQGTAAFEMARYLMNLLPFALLLAVFGWRELETLALRRAWPPAWRRLAVLALVPLAFVTPRKSLLPGDSVADARPGAPSPLAQNLQIEGRYLLEVMARYPDCAFMARPLESERLFMQRPGDPTTLTTALFGGPLGQVRVTSPDDHRPPLDELIERGTCLLAYRGLDCAIEGAPPCSWLDGLEPVETRTFASRPYSAHFKHTPVITLGVYRLPAEDARRLAR